LRNSQLEPRVISREPPPADHAEAGEKDPKKTAAGRREAHSHAELLREIRLQAMQNPM